MYSFAVDLADQELVLPAGARILGVSPQGARRFRLLVQANPSEDLETFAVHFRNRKAASPAPRTYVGTATSPRFGVWHCYATRVSFRDAGAGI